MNLTKRISEKEGYMLSFLLYKNYEEQKREKQQKYLLEKK